MPPHPTAKRVINGAVKRLLCPLFYVLLACGPESPTPASPTPEPAPKVAPSSATVAAQPDRRAKAKQTFLTMRVLANTHDASRTRELYAALAVKGTVGPDGWKEVKGVESIERQIAQMIAAAPNLQWKSERVFQRDDFIADQYVVVGTNGATGKRAGLRGIALYWFDDEGKVKREHVYIDQLTMLIQTGHVEGNAPEPAALPARDGPWIIAKNDATEEANVVTFKTTWPNKALLTRAFTHEDVASGVVEKTVPTAEFATAEAWGFGDFVVAEMQMKGADGIAKHVVEVAEHDKGQLVRASLYANRLEGKGFPAAK